MKSIFYFFVLFIFQISLYGQGNLQFNQIVIVTDQVQTVPAGKVWKVESYQQQQVGVSTNLPITGCSDLTRPRPYFIDNNSYHSLSNMSTGSANYPSTASNHFPFWLKTGQTMKTSCPGDFLSVIEFNIVP